MRTNPHILFQKRGRSCLIDELMDFNWIVDTLIDYAGGPIPYVAIFAALLLCGLGLPLPEDIILIAGGILAYYGVCDVWTMIAVGLLGVMIGDGFVFWLGHHYGKKLLHRWPFRIFLDESKIKIIRERLQNHGGKLLFSARFMPGVRSTVFFSTGMLHIPFRKLLIYDGLAALISVPAIVYSIFYFGDFLEKVIRFIKKVEGGIVGVIALLILFFILKHYYRKRKPVNEL
jgi:membrane protein DedA with SNARE-associated domain